MPTESTPYPTRLQSLQRKIIELREEMAQEAITNNPDLWTEIRGQESQKRAIVLAAVAGHSILFLGEPGSGRDMLIAAAAQLGVVAAKFDTNPKHPCHNCHFVPENAQQKVVFTKTMGAMGINQAAKTLDVTMAKYDMHVECPGVPMKTRLSNRHGTTLEMAKGQLAVSMESKDPIPEALDDTCGELLKQAVTTFRLGQQQIATIIAIARSAAALERSPRIQMIHLTEAIQYRLDRRS